MLPSLSLLADIAQVTAISDSKWWTQAFLQLHKAVLGRNAPEATAHVVAGPEERQCACATLAAATQCMHELRGAAQHTALHAPWLPQYAMWSYMAEQLTQWLQGGYEGSVSLFAEAGMHGVLDGLAPELMAAHQAIRHYE